MQAILVDFSGPEPAAAYVATLLGACSSAVRSGQCARAAPQAVPREDELVVHVTLRDELHFELSIDASAERPELTRALVFRSADAVEERFRSVGISIASLVGAGRPEAESEELLEPSQPKPKPKPAAPAPARTAHAAPAEAWRVGAGLQTGAGARDAAPRLGGFLSLSRVLPPTPMFGFLSARYAVGRGPSSEIDLDWTTLGAGLGASLLRQPLALRVQAAVLAQRVAASATDSNTGQSSSASRWLGGGLVAFELGWPAHRKLGAIFGAEVARVSGGTAVRLNQLGVAQIPALQWGFQVGLEYRP